MHCPFCGANDTKVIDSRLVAEGGQVRRRRECLACEERFTTFETAELVMPRLIKQDGSRQPFDEDKLRAGMQRALEKRPVSIERLEGASCKNSMRSPISVSPRCTGASRISMSSAKRSTDCPANPRKTDDAQRSDFYGTRPGAGP